MLQLDIVGIMNDREINNPNSFLCKNGFTPHTASRLLNNTVKSISHQHMEKLCLLLHCTPNDLYVWKTAGKESKNLNQPLHNLIPIIIKPFISSKLQLLPMEKLREIKKVIDEAMKSA